MNTELTPWSNSEVEKEAIRLVEKSDPSGIRGINVTRSKNRLRQETWETSCFFSG